MFASTQADLKWSLALLLALGSVGCSDTASVSGTVTAGGVPLPAGRIGFAAVSGSGTNLGADIQQGAYHVEGLAPGKYKVIVTGSSAPQVIPKTREEAAQLGGNSPKELVKLDHPKNGQEVEVTSGSTTLDFEF